MPLAVKSVEAAREKWARRVAASAGDYKTGVENPRRDWADNAAAANATYVAGVTAAANAGRFAAGVRKAGTSKWKRGATTKGVQRWGPGVAAATTDYASGVSPYLERLRALDLPARGPAGSEQNKARAIAVMDAMHDEKNRQIGT